MSNSKITILHLSDIHFRKKKEEDKPIFRWDVRKKMTAAIASFIEAHDTPDFVVVTGDVAFSGNVSEYKEALGFFDQLKALLSEEPMFLPVPGNHDVDRKQVGEFFSLHQCIVEKELTDKFLENKKIVKEVIHAKLKTFKKFSNQLNPGLYKAPGDYFWVKDFPGINVSFLGLNSAWACESEKDQMNIALGYPQLMAALEKSGSLNRVILMHHPPFNWLKDIQYGKCRTELFKNACLLLHGHDHSDHATVFLDPSSALICLGSNASYTDGKRGYIGFQFVEVDFPEQGCKVRVWPFIFDEIRRNDFIPDRERWGGQKGEAYFDLEITLPGTLGKGKRLNAPQVPETYKKWLTEFHSTISIDLPYRRAEIFNVRFTEFYVELETANPFYEIKKETVVKEKGADIVSPNMHKYEEPVKIDIEELMGRKNFILLRGRAGMGKTTLIRHLAYTVAHGVGPSSLYGFLPVLVFLRELQRIYCQELRSSQKKITFESLLKTYLEETRCSLTMEIIGCYLRKNSALFLVDGLDEVPVNLRESLVDIMAEFQFHYNENRFLFTGRPHGIEGRAMERFGRYIHDIESLDNRKIERFISGWLRNVSARTTGMTDLIAKDMIYDIRNNEYVSIFTGNPLLLSAVCILYQDQKRIPEQRAGLYDRIVENLLCTRFRDPREPEKVSLIRDYLMHLAYTMQTKKLKRTEMYDAVQMLDEIFPVKEKQRLPIYKRHLRDIFEDIESHCGLLHRCNGVSEEVEFLHPSFQEFLAAKHMMDNDIDYNEFEADQWWEETLLLYIGLMNLEMKKRSNEIVMAMLKGHPVDINKNRYLQLLSAKALRDFPPSRREPAAVELAREKLMILIHSDVQQESRIDGGEILGSLGDPRIKSDNMVMIEKGDYLRGSDEDDPDEKPQRCIYLDSFMIGRYPVTNEEFKGFIGDGGYGREEFWTTEGWQWRNKGNISEPEFWHNRQWNGPNFPVVGISWYEACAFAGWLSQKTSKNYRLPTEAEWEKAARGTDGFIYPWGCKFDKALCNSYDSLLRRTSPVGIFPEGRSPYGCMDMAGNVWEWCGDWFDSDYYAHSPGKNPQGPSGGSFRVLRGGGWFSGHLLCRASCRHYDCSSFRGVVVGFRLARSVEERDKLKNDLEKGENKTDQKK